MLVLRTGGEKGEGEEDPIPLSLIPSLVLDRITVAQWSENERGEERKKRASPSTLFSSSAPSPEKVGGWGEVRGGENGVGGGAQEPRRGTVAGPDPEHAGAGGGKGKGKRKKWGKERKVGGGGPGAISTLRKGKRKRKKKEKSFLFLLLLIEAIVVSSPLYSDRRGGGGGGGRRVNLPIISPNII